MLNAFRHQRGSHLELAIEEARAEIRCSTPFGIKEDRTPTLGRTRAARISAQRLSASKRIAHGNAYLDRGSGGCSTPFGIKEDRTKRIDDLVREWQRCSTPFGIKEDRTIGLSSKVKCSRSAQRLSASKRIAPLPTALLAAFALLCSTPFGIKEDRTPTLGRTRAARISAQRLSASKRIAHGNAYLDRGSGGCSTPFGIKEDRTRRR